MSVFCLCVHKVKSLVDNCRVVNKTIIFCCKHCSCLLYIRHLQYFPGLKVGWHRADPF